MGRVIGSRVSLMTEVGKLEFNPGDTVPDEYLKYIRTERVWADSAEAVATPAAEEDLPLNKLGFKKLLEIAKDMGLEFASNPKKAELVEAIAAKQAPTPLMVDPDEEEDLLEEEVE